MLGTRPSDLIPFFDFNRFAELLIDGKEQAPTTTTALNANVRAVTLVQQAEGDIVDAIRTKQNYSIIQLQDLVRDYQIGGNQFGTQLVSLIGDLTWSHAMERKRYPAGTPQGDDPAYKRGQDKLELLKTGSRIFVIEGMVQTDGAGNIVGIYGGQEKPNAGLLSGSTMHSDVGRPHQVWGVQNHRWDFDYDGH